MIKDLEGARVVVESLGDTDIIRASARYPGKFKKLFDKGWKIYQDKFKIDTIIKEPFS
jgi:hypothetical protein